MSEEKNTEINSANNDLSELRERFESEYERSHPRPEIIVDNVVEMRTWERSRWAFIIVIAANIVSSALRTSVGGMRAAAAEGFSSFWQWVSALTQTAGAEGALVLLAFRPRSVEPSKWQKWLDKAILWGSIAGALLVVMGAGLSFFFSGLTQVENLPMPEEVGIWAGYLHVFQSLTSSLLLPLILAGVAEFYGQQRFNAMNAEPLARVRWEEKMRAWRSEMEDAWENYPPRLVIMGDQEIQAERIRAMRTHARVGIRDAMAERNRSALQAIPQQTGRVTHNQTTSVTEAAAGILKDYLSEDNSVPDDYAHVQEILHASGYPISKSLASNLWRAMMFTFLPDNMNGEKPSVQVERAMRYFNE